MWNSATTTPSSWLAFELSILHRLKFDSIAIPLTGDPAIGGYLRRRGVRVTANDVLQADWYRSLAVIQNKGEKLSDDDINLILEDVYVPHNKLSNPDLRNWFGETDAWWFDNIRKNIDRLDTPLKYAMAVSLVTAVGDYALSFNDDTRDLRKPLSHALRRLWTIGIDLSSGTMGSSCQNKTPDAFIAEATADLMFLRVPKAEISSADGSRPWREEWLRGGSDFWHNFETNIQGKLGSGIETKSQFLRQLDDLLGRASHMRSWAIDHVESSFVSTQEIADTIGTHRRVEAIYTKDFTELTGKKAVIITA